MTTYAQIEDVAEYFDNEAWNDETKPTAAQVTKFLERATKTIDRFSGHDWLLHTLTTPEYHDAVSVGVLAGVIKLKHKPVLSVDKVEYYDNSSQTWVTAIEGKAGEHPENETYEVYLESGKIEFNTLRLLGKKLYRVTYTYGYESVPEFVNDLCAMLVALKVIAIKTGPSMASYTLGDLNVSYPTSNTPGVTSGQYSALWNLLLAEAARLMNQISVKRPYTSTG